MSSLAALLLIALAAPGATTRYHLLSGFDELAKGETPSSIVTSDGAVTLGPQLQPVAAGLGAQVLAVLPDGTGGAFVATGDPGKVLHVDPSGKARTLHEAKQPLVTALARDAAGALYAATAPDGRVLRIDVGSGRASEFATVPGTYVWALAHDGGQLWAAAGLKGGLFKLDAAGKPTAVGAFKEKHLRCLSAVAGTGPLRLLAGGGDKGIVYALDRDGRLGALYDSPLDEITAVVAGPDGAVYAAAVSASDKPGSEDPDKRKDVADGGEDKEPKAREVKASEVVRIAPGGEVRLLFKSRSDGAYALALVGDRLYIGTGGRGRLYHVELTGTLALALDAKLEPAELTALASDGGRGLWLGASTPGALQRLGQPRAATGEYLSAVLDARRSAHVGALRALQETPPGTSIRYALRQGNTAEVDATWGPFVAVELERAAPLPNASRYVQVRASLQGSASAAPRLLGLELAYRTPNLPPRVQAIEVLAPGVRIEPMPDDEPKGRTFNVSSSAFDDYRYTPGKPVAPTEPKPRARQTYEDGWRAIVWNAQDDDGDELAADVTLLGLDDPIALPLGRGLHHSFVSFASERLPDGRYRARVQVSDAPDNTPGEASSASLDGPPFVIDHTAPRLRELKVDAAGPRLGIRFSVDDRTPLRGAWCSLDGRDWVAMRPRDGLVDESAEQFDGELTRELGAARVQIVRCAAEDLVGNRGLAEQRVP